MNLLRAFFIFLLLITLSQKAFSQTNFIKGFVVLKNNDTTNGYLKEDAEGGLLEHVIFSDNASGISNRTYTSADIKAFSFNGGNLFESVPFTDINNLPTECCKIYSKRIL